MDKTYYQAFIARNDDDTFLAVAPFNFVSVGDYVSTGTGFLYEVVSCFSYLIEEGSEDWIFLEHLSGREAEYITSVYKKEEITYGHES